MKKEKTNIVYSFFKFIFILSWLYYIYWFFISIKYSIVGISSEHVGIHIESLCNHVHTTYYGIRGFLAGLENFIIITIFIFWWIPLYEILFFIIGSSYKSKKEKTTIKDEGKNIKGESDV